MACSLKPAGVATFSAPKDSNVTIKLNSPNGGAKLVSAVTTPEAGDPVVHAVAGNAFSFQVLQGTSTLVMTFAQSGVVETAAVVEDCGGDPSFNQILTVIKTGTTAGFERSLTIIGTPKQS